MALYKKSAKISKSKSPMRTTTAPQAARQTPLNQNRKLVHAEPMIQICKRSIYSTTLPFEKCEPEDLHYNSPVNGSLSKLPYYSMSLNTVAMKNYQAKRAEYLHYNTPKTVSLKSVNRNSRKSVTKKVTTLAETENKPDKNKKASKKKPLSKKKSRTTKILFSVIPEQRPIDGDKILENIYLDGNVEVTEKNTKKEIENTCPKKNAEVYEKFENESTEKEFGEVCVNFEPKLETKEPTNSVRKVKEGGKKSIETIKKSMKTKRKYVEIKKQPEEINNGFKRSMNTFVKNSGNQKVQIVNMKKLYPVKAQSRKPISGLYYKSRKEMTIPELRNLSKGMPAHVHNSPYLTPVVPSLRTKQYINLIAKFLQIINEKR